MVDLTACKHNALAVDRHTVAVILYASRHFTTCVPARPLTRHHQVIEWLHMNDLNDSVQVMVNGLHLYERYGINCVGERQFDTAIGSVPERKSIGSTSIGEDIANSFCRNCRTCWNPHVIYG